MYHISKCNGSCETASDLPATKAMGSPARTGSPWRLSKTPLFLYNLNWPVTITTQHIKIGCQTHKIEEWRNFDDGKISDMSYSALEFWTKYKSVIMALADAHSADSNDFYCRDCDAPTDVYQDDEEDITDTTPSSVP